MVQRSSGGTAVEARGQDMERGKKVRSLENLEENIQD